MTLLDPDPDPYIVKVLDPDPDPYIEYTVRTRNTAYELGKFKVTVSIDWYRHFAVPNFLPFYLSPFCSSRNSRVTFSHSIAALRYTVYSHSEVTHGVFSYVCANIPEPKLIITDPDPQIEKQQFRIRILPQSLQIVKKDVKTCQYWSVFGRKWVYLSVSGSIEING